MFTVCLKALVGRSWNTVVDPTGHLSKAVMPV
jgi:hypothetical protein